MSEFKIHRSKIMIVLVTVFIDLLGFGIIIPIAPYFLQEFVTNPEIKGRAYMLLLASYSGMQFLFAPVFGRLSDKIGRRKIILFCLLGSALTHVMFALSVSVWMLYLSRFLSGIFAATVPTAMAYIADITGHENRARGMGMIGAAFGLGFILGPAIGGTLSSLGLKVPILAAAGLSFIAFIVAFFKLDETVRTVPAKNVEKRQFSLGNLYRAIQHPNVGILFIIFFAVTLSFANLETIFVFFTQDKFGLTATQNGYIFAFIGTISVIVQGGLISKLVRKFGEIKLITFATLFLSISFFIYPLPGVIPVFLMVVALTSFSIAIHNPSLISLVSKNSSNEEQGGILGLNQSFSSLGRLLGPFWAGYFFDKFGPEFPFYSAGLLIFIAFLLSLRLYRKNLVESNRN